MASFNISDAVHAVFDNIVGHDNIIVIQKSDTLLYIVIQSRTNPRCIYLDLFISTTDNNIHVNNLDNCQEQQQGKKLLELVEKLAKNIRSSQITLVDASKIKLSDGSVSLKTLYNLTTGQSWYNSLGYICLDITYGTYETLYEENLRKIQTVSVSNFIEDVKDQMGDKLVEQVIDNTFTEINEIFKDILTPAMTIQTYFTKVKDILKENTSPNIHLLIGLLSYIDVANIITTSISDCLLVKLLNPAGGKRGEIIPRNKRKTRRTGRKQDRRHKKYSNRRSQKTL